MKHVPLALSSTISKRNKAEYLVLAEPRFTTADRSRKRVIYSLSEAGFPNKASPRRPTGGRGEALLDVMLLSKLLYRSVVLFFTPILPFLTKRFQSRFRQL